MNELSDKNVIIAIVLTIALVFALIFSTKPTIQDLDPPLQWRDTIQPSSSTLEI